MKELADLKAPEKIKRKPLLEAKVQEQCVKWARGRGYWARKFSSMSQRSVPDYLFAAELRKTKDHRCRYADAVPGSCTCCATIPALKFACEFKKEGCKRDWLTGLMSTEAQIQEQNEMRAAGWMVFECDDFEVFKKTVLAYEKEVGA